MTATGSSLIELQNQSCAWERSIYVCGELLILGKSVIRHTQASFPAFGMIFTIRFSSDSGCSNHPE